MSYQILKNKMYDLYKYRSIKAILSWDLEVKMPSNSDRGFRSDQSATINGLIHEMKTHPELYDLTLNLLNHHTLNENQLRSVEIIKKDIEHSKKLTKEFVEKETKTNSIAYTLWEQAKNKSDFSIFKESLVKIVDIQREKADLLGYEDHPYNALLNQYEEGSKVADLNILFTDVALRLKPLIQEKLNKQKPCTSYFTQYFESKKQMELLSDILDFLNLDRTKYRLDISSHPFSINFHPTDGRITTRINEHDLRTSIWSALHECGHASYEMGLNTDELGMPISQSVSLGIHESQSRFWENNIGRSREFIEAILPILVRHFPEIFAKSTVDELFEELNHIEPTLIRTESDELTYHYHIMIRYEIEKKLMDQTLKAEDVREFWNAHYKQYLNLDVKNDASGCLQDVHWSFGGIGYFPTYSQGSFYASQWYDTIQNQIPSFHQLIKNGDFSPIFNWHKENIHNSGRLLTSNQLSNKISKTDLDFKYFEKYIQNKFNLK